MFNFNPACASANASFPPNANITAPNFNQNVGLAPNVNMSQNNPLSFLTMPPPNLIASQHVFSSAINTNSSPAFFGSNMAIRPPQPFVSPTGTNVPDMKIFQNVPPSHMQSVNMFPNNAQNLGNPGFSSSSGNVHLEPFSQAGNSFNHIHNPNSDNRSQAPHFNPWSPPPSTMNNFSNVSSNALQNSLTFQSSNRNNKWSDPSRNSTSSETSQNRSFRVKFNEAKSKASDINPWMNPPTSFADICSNNYGNGARRMQSPPNNDARHMLSPTNKGARHMQSLNNGARHMQSPPNNGARHMQSSLNNGTKQMQNNLNAKGYNSNECPAWKRNSNGDFKFSNHHGKQHQSNWKSENFTSISNNSSFQQSGNYKNFRNNNFHRRKNNNFKDQEDNGGSKPYTCDTCDRGFATEQDFKLHLSEHIKCNAGNCDFQAHPKIVALHKKMQHETGYAEAINKLKDDEEIAKWRAERKRRFPTAENVRKRKAEQAEKEARGEVIETKDFGQMKKPRFENRFNKRNNRVDRRNKHFNSANVHFRNEKLLSNPKVITNVTLDSDTDSDDDSHIKLQKFPGITYLKENPVQKPEEIVINSDEIDSDKIGQNESDSPKMPVADKNEEEKDADLNDEAPVGIPINKTSPSLDVFSAKEDSDDEPPSELPSEKCIETELLEDKESDIHEINDASDVESPTKKPDAKVPLNEISNSDKLISKDKHSTDNGEKSNKKCFDRNRNKFSNRHNEVEQNTVRKSTLLEKLLADDIRHERNVIMQCIRYIVTNNFFDIGE